MPGNIAYAAPASVMPQTLCLSFAEARQYATLENTYHDGVYTVGALAATSRRTFKLSKRLNATALATLVAFWNSVGAGLTPFYFYNPFDGSPIGSNYDATGVSTTGRITVRFNGDWAQSTDMARSMIQNLELIEVE